MTETARELGVNINTLHTWITKYHRPKMASQPRKNDEHVYDEVKRLRKELKKLKEEHAILKRRQPYLQEKVSEIPVRQGQPEAFQHYCHVSGYVCIDHGLYDWGYRPESNRSQEDRALKAGIRIIHEKHRQRYGERRIKDDLADHGKNVSCQRISRLMKEEGIACKTKRKFKATTDSSHNKPVAENLLNRNFKREQPNEAYVGDITYIRTREGWLYLSVFIDLHSRAVVGWSMRDRMTASLVTDSLMMAMWKRRPVEGLLVHSDRGSQYVSESYQKLLKDNGFICSMSRKGNCWDNAVAESFFHTLKVELVHHEDFQTRAFRQELSDKSFQTRDEAKQAIFEYIEVYYNCQRKHSGNGYLAPFKYEQELAKAA